MRLGVIAAILLLLVLAVPNSTFFGQLLPADRNTSGSREDFKPTPLPTAVVTRAEVPVTLLIPKIGVNAKIEQVGLDAQKRMDVPTSWETVGWYKLGPRPGEIGNSVIDGHLDSPTGPAVFWNLSQLLPGDTVTVIDKAGNRLDFKVTGLKSYKYNQVPMEEIFGDTTSSRLNLITCEGTWDSTARNYSNRLVVFSVLE